MSNVWTDQSTQVTQPSTLVPADDSSPQSPVSEPLNEPSDQSPLSTVFSAVEPAKPQSRRLRPGQCRATKTTPDAQLLLPDEPLAFDVEFQMWKKPGMEKFRQRIGRVAVVNTEGAVVLDTYAAYDNEPGMQKFFNHEKWGFAVSKRDTTFTNGAQPARFVEDWLKRLFQGRIVIMHSQSDRKTFYHEQDVFTGASKVVDTQVMYAHEPELNGHRQPKLKDCASVFLDREIQAGGHGPVEDSQATMDLYLLRRPYDRASRLAHFTTAGWSPVQLPLPAPRNTFTPDGRRNGDSARASRNHKYGGGSRRGGASSRGGRSA